MKKINFVAILLAPITFVCCGQNNKWNAGSRGEDKGPEWQIKDHKKHDLVDACAIFWRTWMHLCSNKKDPELFQSFLDNNIYLACELHQKGLCLVDMRNGSSSLFSTVLAKRAAVHEILRLFKSRELATIRTIAKHNANANILVDNKKKEWDEEGFKHAWNSFGLHLSKNYEWRKIIAPYFDFEKKVWKDESFDINALPNVCGDTLLSLACLYGDLNIVKYLIEERGAAIDVKNDSWNTPLHYACFKGHLDVVKYLIEEKNVDVYAKNIPQETPLILACGGGHLDVAKYLIEKQNANVDDKNEIGAGLIHYACLGGNLDVIKYLVEEKNVDVQAIDDSRGAPLHYACGMGHLVIVKYLIEKNADVNVKDIYRYTPLHRACLAEKWNVVEYLINHCCAKWWMWIFLCGKRNIIDWEKQKIAGKSFLDWFKSKTYHYKMFQDYLQNVKNLAE